MAGNKLLTFTVFVRAVKEIGFRLYTFSTEKKKYVQDTNQTVLEQIKTQKFVESSFHDAVNLQVDDSSLYDKHTSMEIYVFQIIEGKAFLLLHTFVTPPQYQNRANTDRVLCYNFPEQNRLLIDIFSAEWQANKANISWYSNVYMKDDEFIKGLNGHPVTLYRQN
jgi:hypothetical protein